MKTKNKIGFKSLINEAALFLNGHYFHYEIKPHFAKRELTIVSNNSNKFNLNDLKLFVDFCGQFELKLTVLTPNTVLICYQ